jgi:hypothetical protein
MPEDTGDTERERKNEDELQEENESRRTAGKDSERTVGHEPGRSGTGEGERGTQTDQSIADRESASDSEEGAGEHGTSQRLVRGNRGRADDLDGDLTL